MCRGSRRDDEEAYEEGDRERRAFDHVAASLRGPTVFPLPVEVKAAIAEPTFAELLIDCEEDRVLRAVLVGMLREAEHSGPSEDSPRASATRVGEPRRCASQESG